MLYDNQKILPSGQFFIIKHGIGVRFSIGLCCFSVVEKRPWKFSHCLRIDAIVSHACLTDCRCCANTAEDTISFRFIIAYCIIIITVLYNHVWGLFAITVVTNK